MFRYDPVRSSFDQLVDPAKASDENAHDFDRKVRRLLHQKLKSFLVDRNQLAIKPGDSGGGARRTVDHRHLAEDAAWLNDLNHFATDPDFDLTFVHHEHERAGISLTKNDFAGAKTLKVGLISEHVEFSHNARAIAGTLATRQVTRQCRQCYD